MYNALRVVTGEQVKQSMLEHNLVQIPYRCCQRCGDTLLMVRVGLSLYADDMCSCGKPLPREVSWTDAAMVVNQQTDPVEQLRLLRQFGLEPWA